MLLLQGEGAGSLREYVEEKGLAQISDEGAIGGMIDGVLAAHPKELGQFRAGKTKLQGYFVGHASYLVAVFGALP